MSLIFRFDENNDGVISLKEMKKFVKDIQALLSASELERLESIDENSVKNITNLAFEEMDKDHDGKVSEEEFVKAVLDHKKCSTLLTLKIVNVIQP